MANLRLRVIKPIDSITIKAQFTETLNPLINTSSVVITPNLPSIPAPEVLEVSVEDDVLTIISRPLTPFALYYVTFRSTDSSEFKSLNGQSFLFEDGRTNVIPVSGPELPEDPVRRFLINFLKDNVYNLDTGTLVRHIINGQSTTLSRALYDIRQVKNENYLQVNIIDEVKTRGKGPYDRLNEEGAYEVIRVGKTLTNATLPGTISFTSFPSSPITLQSQTISNEELVAGTGSSTFDGLLLTTATRFVTKLTAVTIDYAGGDSVFYNLSRYGYQVKNARYDDLASTLLTLEDNQFLLSQQAVEEGFVAPVSGDTVTISYEYQNKGLIPDADSVTISQVLDATREVTPALSTEFSLANAPIVDATDTLASFAGITFLNPESNPPFSETHPAFTKEIPFRLSGLPKNTGEYAVDYESGRVFVYGETTNDGTGPYPPTATYKYRNSFREDLDYTFDRETYEVVANPLRDLKGETAKISFNYESTLVPDVDFKAQVHNEVLNERIENRLNSTNSLRVLNSPITNVFRIYNETSGEVYRLSRFVDDRVIFVANQPPRILDRTRERASFTDVFNEVLLINRDFTNVLSTRVLEVLLLNNNIMASTEDVIGASYNSSATFTRTDIFQTEIYFDSQVLSATSNTDRLNVGEYQIDYENGILYVGVTSDQDADLGNINYKKSVINPDFPHLISVDNLYHSISEITGISKRINLLSFDDDEIQPSAFDRADERFLNGDTTLSYVVLSNTITVQDNIKNVRNIYDVLDLLNNNEPTNFAETATVSSNVITLNSAGLQKQVISTVGSGLVVSVPEISSNVDIVSVTSIVRTSDNTEFYDGSAVISGYDITLSGTGSPSVGDEVLVIYNVALTGSSTPIVDYNRGDYFIDYTYLADEILVSYEYGDNVIDFRESGTLDPGDTYYVTYKVGALRDALLRNFGSLVDVPVMNTFDTTLPRENYRDALQGSLQSFTKGPTIPAMKELVKAISHIEPDLIEAAFQVWSLGNSYLYPADVDYNDDLQLSTGKFDNGAYLVNSSDQITFPAESNIKIDDGSLEMWVIPDWDGLDNDATLTFTVSKNDTILDANNIYIGASSYNPTYNLNNQFSVNRTDNPSPIGLPAKVYTHTGFFIYYDDVAKRWNVLARDSETSNNLYSGTITTSGEVYDVKFIPGLGEINDVLRSGTESIKFEFNLDGYDASSPDGYVDGYNIVDGYFPGDGYVPGFSFDGITFMSDDFHYLLDFGKTETTNRFSIYKDGKGYLNFRVYDRGEPKRRQRKSEYKVSADISSWAAGEKHHIGAAWKLNSSDRMDEMHLFIDGEEVPNILRYGGRPQATSTDRFRTVKPELVIGSVPLPTVVGADLVTVAGSDTVTSPTINFSDAGILPGHSIRIIESGFSTYTILGVADNALVLSSTMPATLDDASFSVNEFSVTVSTQVDLFNNIAVSIIDSEGNETEIPGLRATVPSYSISKSAMNENVFTLLGNAEAGDQVVIRTLGLNHRRCRERHYVWGNTSSIIKTQLPPPINLDEVQVFPVLLPLTPIGPDNATLSLGRFVATGLSPTNQPSSATEGRILSARVTGGNVDFSATVTVTINGTTSTGPLFETLTFTEAGTQDTTLRFLTVTSIDIEATPLITSKDSVAVEIKEKYSITVSDGNAVYPLIRYSYKTQTGSDLEGTSGSGVVTDDMGYFPQSSIGNLLVINSPGSVAGTYSVIGRLDNNNIIVSPSLPATFSGGSYDLYNTTIGNSGFQNGWFTFEEIGTAGGAFTLNEGYYDFDYSAYLEIPLDPLSNELIYLGSDLNGENQAKAVIDEFRTLSRAISDVRIGETLAVNDKSFTTDFNSLLPFEADNETLMLLHFDSLPLENDADFWVSYDKTYFQSSTSVNDNFSQSLVVTDHPVILDNAGILNTSDEGTIEFWVSPKFDTYNDPNLRFYFDASAATVEELISTTNGTVQISGSTNQVLSVRLQTDTTNSGIDYFVGGSIENNFKTIRLGKALPSQRTPVKVTYVPRGVVGDRISIFKDRNGFITFNVRANNIDYQVRQPVFWARDSWHRIRASFKFNRTDNQDEIRLFVDGEERGIVTFGSGIIFGAGVLFGQGFAGIDDSVLISDINFLDTVNQIYIGSDFQNANLAQARIDNFRLSNISRAPTVVSGQNRDIVYNSNLSIVLPVIEDAYTTFLLDFDRISFKTDDLAILRDEKFGIFNFTLDVIDSFDIVLSNSKIQQILEDLIYTLKPAHSKVNINYIS